MERIILSKRKLNTYIGNSLYTPLETSYLNFKFLLAIQSVINIVALNVYRRVAATMSTTFQDTKFHRAAILNLASSPQVFAYNPHNLGVML
jgi:hypothetical protein